MLVAGHHQGPCQTRTADDRENRGTGKSTDPALRTLHSNLLQSFSKRPRRGKSLLQIRGASLTDDSVYFEALTSQRDLDLPGVIAMADQIPASTAGAAKLVEGNLLDELVVGPLVVPLGKLVAFWKVNSYHNIAPRIGVP